ncbi:MAG TPA: Tad domain-containing protein [Anaerolineales bacterium]|jgi:hypothetical protein|nr:Tad domain-containing protein [Anaerolineales bacterium]
MRPKAKERGQALVIIALAAVGLFGFSALAIDGSRVFSDRRNAQNAADTAALSAALAKIRNEDYVLAAKDRAADNGYAIDANSNVEVAMCNTLSGPDTCQGIPTQTSNPPTTEELELINPANYVHVKVTSILPATFARIVGRNEFTNILTAIAYAGPVEPKPLVNGYALAAMSPHESNAVLTTGNFTLDIINSGIFSNSDAECTNGGTNGSMSLGGNQTIQVDTSIQTVGEFCEGGNPQGSIPPFNEGVSSIDYPPLVSMPSFSCGSTPGSVSPPDAQRRVTVSPGNHGNLTFPLGAEVIFSPGTHCFSNGLTITGERVIADNVRFLFTGGDFKINSGSLTCNDMQVLVNGGTGVTMGATSHVFCNNVTFFLSTGSVNWTANADYRIYAPTGGDYEGLLFYMPPSNHKSITINGNSSCEMTGTILAVGSKITVNGNSSAEGLNSQIIGDTVVLNGNGNLVIHYNPDDQYQPIDPSVIMLTK